MAELMDSVIAKVAGKEWQFQSLPLPQIGHLSDIDDAISLQQFLSASCRRCDGVKTTTLIFDVHMKVAEYGGLARLGELIQQGELTDLPPSLRVQEQLPPGAKMGVIIHNLQDGTMNIIKMFHFPEKVGMPHAKKICTGDVYIPVYKAESGPHSVRKAIQHLLQRLPGFRVLWNNVSEKQPGIRRAQTAQWAPEDEELRRGIDYINDNAPEGDARNEQTFWILSNIREGSGSPISGWPESKVRNMCVNKSRGIAGASPCYDFPLHTYSMKPFLSDVLLPMIYPLMVLHGVIMIGWPGVGKTPALIVMGLAMGRHHLKRLGVEGVPSWRRDKSLENFRQRVPVPGEALFLDDPNRNKVDLADLKSYLTAEEDQTCSARYNDVKLMRGQPRLYAGNHLAKADEPEADSRTTIKPEELLCLMRHTFPDEKDADIMACLKRAVVFVFGKYALYLRLPSESAEAMVHRIQRDDLHLDLLGPHDKQFLSDYKSGYSSKDPDFASHVQREQDMIQAAYQKMKDAGHIKSYLEKCDHEIQQHLLPRRALVRHLPSSPSSDENDIPATVPFSVQLAGHDQPRRRITNSTSFTYGNNPKRRLTSKTSLGHGASMPSSSACPEELATAAEESIIEEPLSAAPVPEPEQQPEETEAYSIGDEMDVDDGDNVPDEEAARFLHE
ncbi:unnamed protein product [Symbiodinium sp. CCMP2592]|nr:unnamed protein product [Symbiodinium sp. CCMP2592]